MQTDILLKRLQTFEFLRGLDKETLSRLAKNSTWKVYAPDAVVFWEGDTESNLYYLQYGSLKVLKSSPDGREQVLRFISAGEMFNEVGVLANRANPATAVALEESGIWLLPRQALEEIILAHPQTALQIIENMADKIIGLVTLAADLSLKTVEARYAKLLLDQAEGDVIERQRSTNLTEMASHLGTVPDVLSRVIRELTKAGLIEMDKHSIRILDRAGLAERAMIQGK
ncbi:Crp/Fnr family transcriptional regulator [Candidatus Villigracilis saccharophilus]|uniref:Crp/Fnr family transcriptional regulator n=1 Tax=Candidatus Villigracilis saccharophilus TaxID=3140684 RepID=UPI003135F863|nr:Crp/Fnr family transcriptional regulator [Anaerolineales bacterium]